MVQKFSMVKLTFLEQRDDDLLTFSMESFVNSGILCFNRSVPRKYNVSSESKRYYFGVDVNYLHIGATIQ